jgi:late competence protein required for DNA uptake (superfamily II DNA/RNA helicase)
MEVVIYKAQGMDGFFYDMSLNPQVDLAILRKIRGVDKIEIITPEISLQEAEKILKGVYGTSSLFAKMIKSQEFLINRALKKQGISKIKKSVIGNYAIPSLDSIAKVEDYIKGKVVSLNKLLCMERDIGLSKKDIVDIVQALYCERRIKMTPSSRKIKDKHVCTVCERQPCSSCGLGFNSRDILLYAAYNYGFRASIRFDVKRKKISEITKDAYDSIVSFVKGKRIYSVLFCAPNAFEYDVIEGGISEVLKNGGKVLYVTSKNMIFEAKEALKKIFDGPIIDSTDGFDPDFKTLDISICSYNEFPCFHKAFDLVILDERYSFIDRPLRNVLLVCQRAVKERGKFLNITCCYEKERRGIIKSSPEVIMLPTSYVRNPIPEPRIVTSRYLNGVEAFIPPMAMDVIKWSLGEDSRVIIFVPHEKGLNMVYYYLTSVEGIDKDIVDVSDQSDKNPLIKFKKRESKILVSTDFKDASHVIEDVNVIVMYSDDKAYHADTLVYMASMAVMHVKKNLREVVFVAADETETISLARSVIRSLNKAAWEKGYLKV